MCSFINHLLANQEVDSAQSEELSSTSDSGENADDPLMFKSSIVDSIQEKREQLRLTTRKKQIEHLLWDLRYRLLERVL